MACDDHVLCSPGISVSQVISYPLPRSLNTIVINYVNESVAPKLCQGIVTKEIAG